ncbi:hypothetical protein V1498_11430 [Peribacillus sp. SCS-26]|uniref:hypothetical protein n=1 Tax=Paraperibacillus marinus TaxID=3115295 RepID=UPI003905D6BA
MNYEEWMLLSLDDPFTGYLDWAEFRVDVYDAPLFYQVEASIEGDGLTQYAIGVNEAELSVQFTFPDNLKERKIYFHFPIQNRIIQTRLTNNYLEITILK